MRKLLYTPLILLALGGCELIDQVIDTSGMAVLNQVRLKGVEVEDRVLDSAADAADKYCVTPAPVRLWLRVAINSRTEVATVIITCGDAS